MSLFSSDFQKKTMVIIETVGKKIGIWIENENDPFPFKP
jgi:hypothetical protein